MEHQNVIDTLNSLLKTTKDGEQGFRTCADAVNSPRVKSILEDAASRCGQGAAELEAKIRGLGGEPAASGTAGGTMHRACNNRNG